MEERSMLNLNARPANVAATRQTLPTTGTFSPNAGSFSSCSASSMRWHPLTHLQLQIRVLDTERRPCLYQVRLFSPSTNHDWCVVYRFADFIAFQNHLLDGLNECLSRSSSQSTLATATTAPVCRGCCATIKQFLSYHFPKRNWLLGRMHKKRRCSKLEFCLNHLLQLCLNAPHNNMLNCLIAREHVPTLLFEFLQVTHELDQRTLLQIYIDSFQPVVRSSTLETGESNATAATLAALSIPSSEHAIKIAAEATNAEAKDVEAKDAEAKDAEAKESNQSDSERCAICLDILPQVDHCEADHSNASANLTSVVKLLCGHRFHRPCLFQWTALHRNCPLCRGTIAAPYTLLFRRCRWCFHLEYGSVA